MTLEYILCRQLQRRQNQASLVSGLTHTPTNTSLLRLNGTFNTNRPYCDWRLLSSQQRLCKEDCTPLRLVCFSSVEWGEGNFGNRAFCSAKPWVWNNGWTSDSRTCHTAVSDSRWRRFYLVSRTKVQCEFHIWLRLEILLLTYLLTSFEQLRCTYKVDINEQVESKVVNKCVYTVNRHS